MMTTSMVATNQRLGLVPRGPFLRPSAVAGDTSGREEVGERARTRSPDTTCPRNKEAR